MYDVAVALAQTIAIVSASCGGLLNGCAVPCVCVRRMYAGCVRPRRRASRSVCRSRSKTNAQSTSSIAGTSSAGLRQTTSRCKRWRLHRRHCPHRFWLQLRLQRRLHRLISHVLSTVLETITTVVAAATDVTTLRLVLVVTTTARSWRWRKTVRWLRPASSAPLRCRALMQRQ